MVRPNRYEELLPAAARQRAVRLKNGEAAWDKRDMDQIVGVLAHAKLAIVSMEVWAVSEDSALGRIPFRNPANPLEVIEPLGPAADGRLVWGELPTRDGQETVFRMGGHDHPDPGESWEEFVLAKADLARTIVTEVDKRVVPAVRDKLYFELTAALPEPADTP